MEIRPGGRITICRLKAKATAGATKAAFSGRSLVAVRNLMLRTIRQAPPWRATLKGSPLRFAPLRSLRDALGGSSRIRASRLRTTAQELLKLIHSIADPCEDIIAKAGDLAGDPSQPPEIQQASADLAATVEQLFQIAHYIMKATPKL